METGKRKGLQGIVDCMSCGLGFWDKYNLLCLNALDLCLHCASKKPNIEKQAAKLYER
jgi:hypothetical protein|tara:strand:+ start:606 stop:779 length:174 start_codon:yes stop_codon:yes gene_type:complete